MGNSGCFVKISNFLLLIKPQFSIQREKKSVEKFQLALLSAVCLNWICSMSISFVSETLKVKPAEPFMIKRTEIAGVAGVTFLQNLILCLSSRPFECLLSV